MTYKYVCDVCGSVFDDEYDCQVCEKKHLINTNNSIKAWNSSGTPVDPFQEIDYVHYLYFNNINDMALLNDIWNIKGYESPFANCTYIDENDCGLWALARGDGYWDHIETKEREIAELRRRLGVKPYGKPSTDSNQIESFVESLPDAPPTGNCRIKEVNIDYILFTDGSKITYGHERDCCEWNYADFRQLDDIALLSDYNIATMQFNFIEDMGFEFTDAQGKWHFVPCYSEQNGYYSSDVNIYLNDKLVASGDCDVC